MAFPDFPMTPVLDDFYRANESPLTYGGRWARALSTATSDLRVVSNVCTTTGSTQAYQYWTPQQFTDFEVYVTLNLNERSFVQGRITTPGGVGLDMYTLRYSDANTEFAIQRGGVSGTILATTTIAALGAGDKIMLRGRGTELTGWTFTGSVWQQRVTANDSTYTTGFIGLASFDATFSVDDFGGGAIIERNIAPPMTGRARW